MNNAANTATKTDDLLVRESTAFNTLAEFKAACASGYVPTLHVGKQSGLIIRCKALGIKTFVIR